MSGRREQATVGELTLTTGIKDASGNTKYTPSAGHIYTDTVTGTKYTIAIQNGTIVKVEV